jgi:hypothetical protein
LREFTQKNSKLAKSFTSPESYVKQATSEIKLDGQTLEVVSSDKYLEMEFTSMTSWIYNRAEFNHKSAPTRT